VKYLEFNKLGNGIISFVCLRIFRVVVTTNLFTGADGVEAFLSSKIIQERCALFEQMSTTNSEKDMLLIIYERL
jgi:hypothetical protein